MTRSGVYLASVHDGVARNLSPLRMSGPANPYLLPFVVKPAGMSGGGTSREWEISTHTQAMADAMRP